MLSVRLNMQFTLFIIWFTLMLFGAVQMHHQQQQHDHLLLTTIDDYYKYPVCRPGSHLASAEMCELCAEGHTYTEHYNRDISCESCKVCGSNEVSVAACTITRNTRCHCARDFYRHTDGNCISRQQVVRDPAGGASLRNRGVFGRPTPWSFGRHAPWSAESTTGVAKTSGDGGGGVSVTLTSSTDEPGITPVACFRASSTVENANSGSPCVTAATPFDGVASSTGATNDKLVTTTISRSVSTEDLKSASTLGTAAATTGDGIPSDGVASSTGATNDELVTTTVSRSVSTEDLKSASTLGTAAATTRERIHQNSTKNSTCADATCYVHSHSDVSSTTIGTDSKVHGGILQDDCGVVPVESDQCLPWKVATAVLIVIVVIQMVIIAKLVISGAARRYIVRRNTASFATDSERSEWTSQSSPMSVPKPASSFSLPEPERHSVERSESIPSSEVISL